MRWVDGRKRKQMQCCHPCSPEYDGKRGYGHKSGRPAKLVDAVMPSTWSGDHPSDSQSRQIHNLARIHNPLGVKSLLDLSHDSQRLGSDFQKQRVLFAPADRVLTRAGSIHVDGALDHVLDTLLHLFPLFLVRVVIDDAFMEVAISNVSEDAGEETHVVHLLFADLDEVSQSAEWYGNIRAPCTGRQYRGSTAEITFLTYKLPRLPFAARASTTTTL